GLEPSRVQGAQDPAFATRRQGSLTRGWRSVGAAELMRDIVVSALVAVLLLGTASPDAVAQGSAPRPPASTPASKLPAAGDQAHHGHKHAPVIVPPHR